MPASPASSPTALDTLPLTNTEIGAQIRRVLFAGGDVEASALLQLLDDARRGRKHIEAAARGGRRRAATEREKHQERVELVRRLMRNDQIRGGVADRSLCSRLYRRVCMPENRDEDGRPKMSRRTVKRILDTLDLMSI